MKPFIYTEIIKRNMKEIIDEITYLDSPFEGKNPIDKVFNSGFENMRRKVLKIIKDKSGFDK